MKCKVCGTEMPTYALYCAVCGAPLETKKNAADSESRKDEEETEG